MGDSSDYSMNLIPAYGGIVEWSNFKNFSGPSILRDCIFSEKPAIGELYIIYQIISSTLLINSLANIGNASLLELLVK